MKFGLAINLSGGAYGLSRTLAPDGLTFSVTDGGLNVDFTTQQTDTHLELDITAAPVAAWVGTFTVVLADLAAGPVNLVPVSFTGTTNAGDVITITPGLWLSEGGLAVTQEIVRGGSTVVSSSFDDYTIVADDVTLGLTLRETTQDANGSTPPVSATVVSASFSPATISIPEASYITATNLGADDPLIAIAFRSRPTGNDANILGIAKQADAQTFTLLQSVGLNQLQVYTFNSGSEPSVMPGRAANFYTTMRSNVIIANLSTGDVSIWSDGAVLSGTLAATRPPSVRWSGQFAFGARIGHWDAWPVHTNGGMELEGALRIWRGWAPSAADLAALVFNGSGESYSPRPWAADGAVNDGSQNRTPLIHFVASKANWDAGVNAGSGGNFTPVGTVTEI